MPEKKGPSQGRHCMFCGRTVMVSIIGMTRAPRIRSMCRWETPTSRLLINVCPTVFIKLNTSDNIPQFGVARFAVLELVIAAFVIPHSFGHIRLVGTFPNIIEIRNLPLTVWRKPIETFKVKSIPTIGDW